MRTPSTRLVAAWWGLSMLAACVGGAGQPAAAPEPAIGSRSARKIAIRGVVAIPAGGLAVGEPAQVVVGLVAQGRVFGDDSSWSADGESWVLLLTLNAEVEIVRSHVVSAGSSGRVDLTRVEAVPGGLVRLHGTFAGSLAIDGETVANGDFRTVAFSLLVDDAGRAIEPPAIRDSDPPELPDGVPFVLPSSAPGDVTIFSAWLDQERGAFTVGAVGNQGFAARVGQPGSPTWWTGVEGAHVQWLETLVLAPGVVYVAGAGGREGRVGSMALAEGADVPRDGLSPVIAALNVRDGSPRWAWTDEEPAPRVARALAVDPRDGAVWVGTEEWAIAGSGPEGEIPWLGEPGVVVFRLEDRAKGP